MTGLLKDLMHDRADTLDAPTLDVDRMVRDGGRQVARRRTAWLGGGVAAVAVAALALPGLVPDGGDRARDPVVADGSDARPQPLTWVTDSVLHTQGGDDVDLGAGVRSYVQVDGGIVYADPQRAVHARIDGEVSDLGRIHPDADDEPELATDGRLVAWLDADRGLRAHDTATGTTHGLRLQLPDVENGPAALVTAVADGTVYARDARGVFSWDIADDDVRILGGAEAPLVLDADPGVTVLGDRSLDDGSGRLVWSEDGSTLTVPNTEWARVSPDGRYVSTTTNDVGYVLDVRTQEEVALRHDHDWVLGYAWLDDDTLALMTFDEIDGSGQEEMHGVLMTCEVPSGSCEDSRATLSPDFGSFRIPVGVNFAD